MSIIDIKRFENGNVLPIELLQQIVKPENYQVASMEINSIGEEIAELMVDNLTGIVAYNETVDHSPMIDTYNRMACHYYHQQFRLLEPSKEKTVYAIPISEMQKNGYNPDCVIDSLLYCVSLKHLGLPEPSLLILPWNNHPYILTNEQINREILHSRGVLGSIEKKSLQSPNYFISTHFSLLANIYRGIVFSTDYSIHDRNLNNSNNFALHEMRSGILARRYMNIENMIHSIRELDIMKVLVTTDLISITNTLKAGATMLGIKKTYELTSATLHHFASEFNWLPETAVWQLINDRMQYEHTGTLQI